jgi:hypothetical protein
MLYDLVIGDFKGLHKTTYQPMKLLSYFPLYMYDTNVSHIPSVQGLQKEMCLSLNYFHKDEIAFPMIKHAYFQNILESQNPNDENKPFMFALKNDFFSSNIPFLDRSYYFRFDLISNTDEPDQIVQTFDLFEVHFTQPNIVSNNYICVSLQFNLQKTTLTKDNFYEGNVKVLVKHHNRITNKTDIKTLATISIDGTNSLSNSIKNFFSQKEYLNSKYKNSGFKSVLKPISALFNVALFIF